MFVVLAGLIVALLQQPAPPSAIAIEHVTVIDVSTSAKHTDQTVVVNGNRIEAVGPSSTVRSPAGARIVDGRGKFLIPGIWDMHVHILHNLPLRSLPMFAAHGISGVREMGGSLDALSEARRFIDAGGVAPRVVASGPALDGAPLSLPIPPGSDIYVSSPDEGRMIVDRLVAQRVDFVKIHNQVPKDTFLAIAAEARRWKLPVAGHLPLDMTAAEASDAGYTSIEHIGSLGASCVDDPAVLRPPARGTPPPTGPIAINREKCEAAAKHLVKNGTFFTPTIGAPGTGDPRTRAFNLAVLRIAFKAGLKLLAGTDGPGPGYWRGDYSRADRMVQDEMAGMVEAGLTPLEALRTSTVNAAAVFHMSDQLGSVEVGKLADLLLLDADPLADIANTKRINSVVIGGRLIDTDLRRKLLDDEETMRNGNVHR
jgi:imidazolonepropionase-like amidohydrolase